MRRSPLFALVLWPLVACGGAEAVVKSPPYDALDGRTTNPGRHYGPEEVGPPITTARGRFSVVKRDAKEMYYENQLSEFRYASTYYTVVREGQTNPSIGWYSRVVVTPEGDVYVKKASGGWVEYDPATYKTTDRVKVVEVLSDGAAMKGGSGSEMFIMLEKPRKERADSYSAKSWDANGTLVKSWDDIAGAATGSMLRVGKLDVFFPVGPNGERSAQLLDERHLPKGEPVVGLQELRMNLPNEKGVRSYLARPSTKDPSLYVLMLENGTFDTPPELIGMRRMPTKVERAGQNEKVSEVGSIWLMNYETKAGKRWGWAASDFSEQSGPIWSTVKAVEGPDLHTWYGNENSRATPLVYAVVEDAATKKWNALLPRLPLGSLTKESFATEQEAVAGAEAVCRTLTAARSKEIAEAEAAKRAAAEASNAAAEANKKAIADRRTSGGATKDKDERWAAAMNNWRANVGSPEGTAMQLGGVYLVDWVLERKSSRIEVLERAVGEAKKFDPVAEKKIAGMLKVAQDRKATMKKEEQARANAGGPAVNYERSTQSSYEPNRGTTQTYDIRTGVRSDTQSLQNWTYGRQNWKPY